MGRLNAETRGAAAAGDGGGGGGGADRQGRRGEGASRKRSPIYERRPWERRREGRQGTGLYCRKVEKGESVGKGEKSGKEEKESSKERMNNEEERNIQPNSKPVKAEDTPTEPVMSGKTAEPTVQSDVSGKLDSPTERKRDISSPEKDSFEKRRVTLCLLVLFVITLVISLFHS